MFPTRWKINMEPTNHPYRKQHDLPNLHDYVPAVNLQGCILFLNLLHQVSSFEYHDFQHLPHRISVSRSVVRVSLYDSCAGMFLKKALLSLMFATEFNGEQHMERQQLNFTP